MENRSLLQSFAIDKSGRVRSVEEVARGLGCECVCSVCGEPLLARQGEVREWHFAHSSGADCSGAAESALHAAAKQLLADSKGMTVPGIRVAVAVELPDGRRATGEANRPELRLDFDGVELEKTLGTIRPDVYASWGSEALCVEIAVTHFVDAEKRDAIGNLDLPTIEIDLADTERQKWSWEDLRDAVIDGTAKKTWIHLPDTNSLEEEARLAGLRAAWDQPMPEAVHAAPRGPMAPRTRYWVRNRMVDVIERPFGLAVWSPYDPGLNEQIKALVRPLGGRWQPRFKNWLVPLEARDWLFQGLASLSGRPPEVR